MSNVFCWFLEFKIEQKWIKKSSHNFIKTQENAQAKISSQQRDLSEDQLFASGVGIDGEQEQEIIEFLWNGVEPSAEKGSRKIVC